MYDRTELVDQVLDTVRKNLFEGGLARHCRAVHFLGQFASRLDCRACNPTLDALRVFRHVPLWDCRESVLSLGAIDFGLVVDSSVVMVENCVRYLSHDSERSQQVTADSRCRHRGS